MQFVTLFVHISMSIIFYTKYDNYYIYTIAEKYIILDQIVCKYIGNKIVENSIKSFVTI